MTFGELKREIARMEKNGLIDDNTEALVDDSGGHLIGFDVIYPYIDELKED